MLLLLWSGALQEVWVNTNNRSSGHSVRPVFE